MQSNNEYKYSKMKELTDFLESLSDRERDKVKVEIADACNLSIYTIEAYRRCERSPKGRTKSIICDFIKNYKKKSHRA